MNTLEINLRATTVARVAEPPTQQCHVLEGRREQRVKPMKSLGWRSMIGRSLYHRILRTVSVSSPSRRNEGPKRFESFSVVRSSEDRYDTNYKVQGAFKWTRVQVSGVSVTCQTQKWMIPRNEYKCQYERTGYVIIQYSESKQK